MVKNEQDSDEEKRWIAAFLGTALSGLLFSIIAEVFLRIDFLLGVGSGFVLGFLFGLAFMARRYGASESMPAWLISRAETGWELAIGLFVSTIILGIIGVSMFSWIILIERRFGETADLWAENLLLILLPVLFIGGPVFMYYFWKYTMSN